MSDRVPEDTEEELIYKTDSRCPLCDGSNQGHHIHHIDGNRDNNELNNLIFLCFKHHSELEKSGGMERRLTKKDIKRFREEWYDRVEKRRERQMEPSWGTDLNHSRIDDIQKYVDSNVIVEVQKLRMNLMAHGTNWDSCRDPLKEIGNLIDISSSSGALAISEALYDFSTETRYGMTIDIANLFITVTYQLIDVFVPDQEDGDFSKLDRTGLNWVIETGGQMVYDGAVKIQNLEITEVGGRLIYDLGRELNKYKSNEFINNIVEEYNRAIGHHHVQDTPHKKLLVFQLNNLKENDAPPLTYPIDIAKSLGW